MTAHVTINGCLETDCPNPGGKRLLCDEHAAEYDSPPSEEPTTSEPKDQPHAR